MCLRSSQVPLKLLGEEELSPYAVLASLHFTPHLVPNAHLRVPGPASAAFYNSFLLLEFLSLLSLLTPVGG